MAELKVCRICLVKNVTLENLYSYPLNKYFEAVTGINPCMHDNILPYVCYQCSAFIKKFFNFRQKCLRTQATLFEIVLVHGKLTEQNVNNILNDNQLQVKLSRHIVTEDNFIDYVHEDKIDTEVKDEFSDTETQDTQEIQNLQDTNFSIDIKVENFFPDPSSPCHDSLSSDDEPLSVHKNIKENLFKKNKNKVQAHLLEINGIRSYTLKNEIEGYPGCDVSEIAIDDPPKRKRGRPKKIKETKVSRRTLNTGGVYFKDENMDLEQCVTVVKLSLEEQLEEIYKRKTSSNYLNAAFQCNFCYKGFINEKAWKHHVEKHDRSAGDEECVVCKFRFKTRRALQKHVMNHEKKYCCKTCSFISKSLTQAKQHQLWHSGVTYKCQYCDEISTKWTSYLSHVRMKHPSEFICGVCGYSFVSKIGLSMHVTMMHKQANADEGQPKGPFCAECDVQFVSEEAWKRHLITSAKHPASESRHGCRLCGDWFSSREELRVHSRREHPRRRPHPAHSGAASTRPANCPHCSEAIANPRDLWTHFRRAHPGEKYPIQKNYVCDICGKSFRGNAFLVYHKRTHTEERTYKCKQCPKAFFNRINLQMHEKCHSENRPYPCTVCLKAFKCKGALDRHFRSHTGVKPYQCEFCGKAFGQSNSRKLHVQTVHLKQPAPYVSKTRQRRKDQPASNSCQFTMYQQ